MAEAIVKTLQEREGVMEAADLEKHRTAFVEPISTTYRGHRVYEVPPPTQVRVCQLVSLETLKTWKPTTFPETISTIYRGQLRVRGAAAGTDAVSDCFSVQTCLASSKAALDCRLPEVWSCSCI